MKIILDEFLDLYQIYRGTHGSSSITMGYGGAYRVWERIARLNPSTQELGNVSVPGWVLLDEIGIYNTLWTIWRILSLCGKPYRLQEGVKYKEILSKFAKLQFNLAERAILEFEKYEKDTNSNDPRPRLAFESTKKYFENPTKDNADVAKLASKEAYKSFEENNFLLYINRISRVAEIPSYFENDPLERLDLILESCPMDKEWYNEKFELQRVQREIICKFVPDIIHIDNSNN